MKTRGRGLVVSRDLHGVSDVKERSEERTLADGPDANRGRQPTVAAAAMKTAGCARAGAREPPSQAPTECRGAAQM
jgi:hypothetical protein